MTLFRVHCSDVCASVSVCPPNTLEIFMLALILNLYCVCLVSPEWQGLWFPGAAELGAAAGAGGDGEIMQRSQRREQDTGETPSSLN